MQVDLGAARGTHVEVGLRIDALERHAVVMDALAMRDERQRGRAARAAERAVRVQLAAALGGEQTHVGRIDRELQRKLLAELAIERKVGLSEAHAHRRELPGFAAPCDAAAAARRKSAQLAGDAVQARR